LSKRIVEGANIAIPAPSREFGEAVDDDALRVACD
jgi:hypothetical protein